jgi:membrane protein
MLRKNKQIIIANLTLFWQYIKYVIRQFYKDNCFESASALTYTTLLSIVPFMAVSVFIMQGIPYFQDLWAETQQFIFSHFIPASGREVERYLQEFIRNTGKLTIIGILFLVSSAMILIFTIEQTFNRIWAVKSTRSIINSFLLYWAILSLLPILMGLSFGVSSYIWSLPVWQSAVHQVGSPLKIIPFLLIWFSFALIYILLPHCYVNRKHAFQGAFIVALLFEISKRLFASYVSSINMNVMLYGAFATIPIFLLWIYISWLIILFGAELVNAMSYHKFTANDTSEWRFIQAYKWISLLWHAQKVGQALSPEELFKSEGKLTAIEPFAQLEVLESRHWIQKTEEGKYCLAKDLSYVTLYDFYNSLPWRLPESKNLVVYQDNSIKLLKSQIEQINRVMQQNMQQSIIENFKLD